ncbi:tetratricopeptide repeat protein [Desulfobacula sp.]|uniref:tetratricopeptide repeat protein n=1 Tax=Desulfobacula sp. TaxID=2593537 RepID=UPI0026070267|nr:tetratricopeptide repeat protein [Desulfobacula sp.]
MFNAWLGFAYWLGGTCDKAYSSLREALNLGEDTGNQELVGYACTWLTWNSAELGKFEEVFRVGERTYEISKLIKSDHYLVTKPLTGMAKNIGFIIKNVPVAAKKAEAHFKRAIELAEEIGANGIAGEAYLNLGQLYKPRNKINPARKCLSKAIEIFK